MTSAAASESVYKLLGPDPVAAMDAAMAVTREAQEPPTDIIVTIYDKFYNVAGDLSDYIELEATFARLELPTATLNLMGVDPIADLVLACDTEVVPVTIDIGALRWSGRVINAHDKINEDGSETVECQLIGDLAMLDAILTWPEPFLPIEIQPSQAIYMGPAITVIKTMVAENTLRIQLGINELINNLGSLNLDWRAWFGTLLTQQPSANSVQALMQMVVTPVCVIFGDTLTDTSPWISMHGRMNTCWKLMLKQLEDNGLYPSMDLWLPGDPQPEGRMYDLTVPTYIFNVRDYSGVTGPSGTVLDGGVRDLVDLTDSLLGNVLKPFLNPKNNYVPPGSNIQIAPTLGVNYTPPWVIFNADAPHRDGIVTLDITHHHPFAWSAIVGGKSPQWLNKLMNATAEYLIDMLMIGIGISGIPDDLLDGILDNALLAFELYQNFDMRVLMGPYGYPEKFFPLQSTYDIDEIFAAIDAMWQIKGYPSAQVSFYNGMPYTLGKDLFPGAQASVVRRSTLYTDYLDKITIKDSRKERAKVTGMIGDGRREESAATIVQRRIIDLDEDINLMLLAPGTDSGGGG